MDIPIFGKKRSFLQSSDIPRHTWPVVGGDDFLGSLSKRYLPFFLGDDRFENILDSNGG
jgi:hypothetical protein